MILPLRTFQPLNHANLKCLKKSSQKPGDWHFKPGEYMSNKTKKAEYFYLSWYFLPFKWSLLYSLVALLAAKRRFCFTLQVDRTAGGKVRAFPQTLLNLHFTGMRFKLDSGFPPKLDWYNSSITKTGFFKLCDSYRNCPAIFFFSDSPWHLEAISWDRELSQTVRVGRSASYPLVKDVIPVDILKEFMSHDLFSIICASTKAVKIMICILISL